MILDVNYFGQGAGLVIIGWVCGLCVGTVLKVLSHARS